MAGWQLRTTDGRIIASHLEIAATYWSRLAGLQFRNPLPDHSALLIVPCPSIHTLFVRFPLDVAFVDSCGIVVEVHHSVRPWRVVIPKQRAHAVIEMTAGSLTLGTGEIARISTQPGSPNLPHLAKHLLQAQ